MRYASNSDSLDFARKELRRWRQERTIIRVLLCTCITAFFILLLLFTLDFLQITGKISSVTTPGGYVTELHVTSTTPVSIWGGIYGLVLRVPDFTQQLSEDLESGAIQRSDIFFDCIQYDATGGPEVYASTSSSLDFSNVRPATAAMVDAFINCSEEVFCANNTFTQNTTVYIGTTNITAIPATTTYKFNGENSIFDVGILNFSGTLVFVSHINTSIQPGYSSDVLVNYQMLLPVPANTTKRYYFFTDPNDVCPAGGIGSSVNASIWGYVNETLSGSLLSNVSIWVAGFSTTSMVGGFYNLSTLVLPGTYTLVAQKEGYNPLVANLSINFSSYAFEKNLSLTPTTLGSTPTSTIIVVGDVKDSGGSALSDVQIWFGNSSGLSNATGNYSFQTRAPIGAQPLFAFKEGYNNYYFILNVSSNTSSIEHSIQMTPANLESFTFPTGPYTSRRDSRRVQEAREAAEKLGQDYWISPNAIRKQLRQNTFVEEKIAIFNFRSSDIQIVLTAPADLSDILSFDTTTLTIPPNSFREITVTTSGVRPPGVYSGIISLGGDLVQDIPVQIEIVERHTAVEALLLDVDLFNEIVQPGSVLKYRINLENLLSDQSYKVGLTTSILDSNGTILTSFDDGEPELANSLALLREYTLDESIPEGKYVLRIGAQYFDLYSEISDAFTISRPLYLYSFFGVPLWIIFVGISGVSFATLNTYLIRRKIQRKKRYHLTLNLDLLPKPAVTKALKIGKVAETNVAAYLDADMLTTHAIVAGATGGGKSIAAQVLVEEALLKNIAVVVFDPTAQWSGMLRKCEDKRMLGLYSKFGLKENDARAFPGNVKQIKNAREAIDIKKYLAPGQIHIFALNKLDPADIDTFVASSIVSIFRSSPEEHPGLRVLLVFDEVHRLLPKFGGTGRGFLQIERACREFRKWGFGVILISQVLSDFVGEIKANINTELQMRVAEENDLERVRERYGEEALRSLVRSDIGVGMVQNAEYNRGLPYFVAFRPILHNTRRLSDEILEKYFKYSEVIEDIEYQLEQLEAEKVDIFDLKMELKLIKDKLMTGNFTVVDIYLEGLTPRLQKQWGTLGKKPKARQLTLVAEADVSASIASAQAERAKWEKEHATATAPTEKVALDMSSKIVRPLTFDNGVSVSSLKELSDVLASLDASVFKLHVNKTKHEIADWIAKEIDAPLGAQVKAITDKAALSAALVAWITQQRSGSTQKEVSNTAERIPTSIVAPSSPTKKMPAEKAKKQISKKKK